MKREVQIKLKAVSAEHSSITYDERKGWFISEQGQEKPSSNGTFVFMKSQRQMVDHEPSALIPLHDGMVISFINYEVRVNLERKNDDEVARQDLEIRQKAEQFSQTANFAATMNAQAKPAVVQDEPEQVVEATPAS